MVQTMQLTLKNLPRAVTLIALIGAMVAAFLMMPDVDPGQIREIVGHAGPAAVVLLVAVGIVVSPIPSGVVAIVAGALYGTWWGGGLTVLGAGLGASIAFTLSRWLGRDVLKGSSLPGVSFLVRARSQNTLMAVVFATRLVPFVSFDAISYVAGVTPIAFWRFLVATVLGTMPVCFAFAALGEANGDAQHGTFLLLLSIGVTLLLPSAGLAIRALQRAFHALSPALAHRQ